MKPKCTFKATYAENGIANDSPDRSAASGRARPCKVFRPMRCAHLILAASYAIVLAISLTLTGCKQAPATKASTPVAVEVAAVTPKAVRLSDEFNGRVVSINSVEVRARVTGYVDKVAYREGDTVKQGDLLFVID